MITFVLLKAAFKETFPNGPPRTSRRCETINRALKTVFNDYFVER
ncbi:hypothetical protein Poly59_53650 [Rubripirellula reticaptiva]|uniref:Uncharacterized protein n=1 Tax=Rubripirellula reticaptiva TaxID=2528013 RepID=A0A5C6EBQ2_9BACT|nr:hypothetical protein Poly59_53650 [Rubripirellula reticaptiva]